MKILVKIIKDILYRYRNIRKRRILPTPEAATDPINLITIYDSLSEKYHTWGTGGSYIPKIAMRHILNVPMKKYCLKSF